MFKTLLIALVFLFFSSTAFCQRDSVLARTLYQKGYGEHAIKDYKMALKYYDSALVANPDYSDVYLERGLMKFYLNDLRGSIDDYNKFIARNPNSSTAFDNRGYSEYMLGDNDNAALSDFDRSIKLDSNFY